MKLIKYYILFLFSINIVKAQPVLKKYKFAVWNKNMQDSFASKSYGKEFEFYSFRYLINDTTFYESGVLESDTANKIFFKIINGNWYAERQDDSQEDMLFFDNQNKLSCSVRINNSVYGILWEKNSDSALGKDNYYLKLCAPKGEFITHLPVYIFNKKFGIIGLNCTDGIILIREDYLTKCKLNGIFPLKF